MTEEIPANLTDLTLDGSYMRKYQLNELSDISSIASLTNLESLDLSDNRISDISPVASLTNLTSLNLRNNQISDISSIASLTNLTSLNLWDNRISDISPLASLTNLTSLNLWNNQISDISSIASLTSLESLDLSDNEVSDKSPLASLANLKRLDGKIFVRKHFIPPEPDEPSGGPESTGPEKSFRNAEALDWEVLPPGWWRLPREVSGIKRKFKGTEMQFREFMGRLEFVDSYNPINTYTTRFSGHGYQYYVFLFNNHVVAECPQYGNAAYVLKGTDNWQSIFRRSRQELKAKYSDTMIWVRHTKTYKRRLEPYLN